MQENEGALSEWKNGIEPGARSLQKRSRTRVSLFNLVPRVSHLLACNSSSSLVQRGGKMRDLGNEVVAYQDFMPLVFPGRIKCESFWNKEVFFVQKLNPALHLTVDSGM